MDFIFFIYIICGNVADIEKQVYCSVSCFLWTFLFLTFVNINFIFSGDQKGCITLDLPKIKMNPQKLEMFWCILVTLISLFLIFIAICREFFISVPCRICPFPSALITNWMFVIVLLRDVCTSSCDGYCSSNHRTDIMFLGATGNCVWNSVCDCFCLKLFFSCFWIALMSKMIF